ncbi:MAG: LysR family transcriptional regulator [Rhodobiaceae bacterium]|nr:LysR family transcriptional regulator [Rhodobiaceae bacterium]MCC0014464.1 LysR family transcriptional regulator [Rhodobiaceae bacterium]MCC0062249.1 LysR family transcriptional regulator [Rhodobiaceae bacterium]
MNFRTLDLNLLRVFNAIHDEGSTTQAAARLGLTQPAVSNALNRLRQHLGDPLFERGPGGMEPTPVARRIAPALADALRLLERSLGADDEFDPATSVREFRMMVPEALEPMLVHPLLKHTSAMPGITFHLLPVQSPGYKDMVLSRETDIAIFPGHFNDESIRSTHVCTLPICIIARDGHPQYGSLEHFTAQDFFEAGFVVLGDEIRRSIQFHQEAKAAGRERRIVLKSTRLWSILHTVASTDLVAAVPRYLAEHYAGRLGLKVFDMPIPATPELCHMGWHQELTADASHIWLRETIKEIGASYR